MMTEPRELTTEECTDRLIAHLQALVRTWRDAEGSVESRLNGLVFSILSMIDGSCIDVPGWRLAPDPHPDAKTYDVEQGLNWWPQNDVELFGEYEGQLHELWSAFSDDNLRFRAQKLAECERDVLCGTGDWGQSATFAAAEALVGQGLFRWERTADGGKRAVHTLLGTWTALWIEKNR
jgi:hypothetical protein